MKALTKQQERQLLDALHAGTTTNGKPFGPHGFDEGWGRWFHITGAGWRLTEEGKTLAQTIKERDEDREGYLAAMSHEQSKLAGALAEIERLTKERDEACGEALKPRLMTIDELYEVWGRHSGSVKSRLRFVVDAHESRRLEVEESKLAGARAEIELLNARAIDWRPISEWKGGTCATCTVFSDGDDVWAASTAAYGMTHFAVLPLPEGKPFCGEMPERKPQMLERKPQMLTGDELFDVFDSFSERIPYPDILRAVVEAHDARRLEVLAAEVTPENVIDKVNAASLYATTQELTEARAEIERLRCALVSQTEHDSSEAVKLRADLLNHKEDLRIANNTLISIKQMVKEFGVGASDKEENDE